MTNPTPDPQRGEIMPRRAETEAEYPLIETPGRLAQVMSLIDGNFNQQKFKVEQLPRIKVMRDAALFQIETAAGVETAPTLTGFITAFRTSRIKWGSIYNPQKKEPPACTSTDGFVGVGNPGGECAKCPYAQFKSARNPDGSPGAGQACSELRQMLFLLPGQTLPHRLDVRPTSLKYFQKYSLTLLYDSRPFWAIVTKLSLEMGTTTTGMSIPHVLFSMARKLTPEQARMMEPYHLAMRDYLTPMTVDVDRHEVTGEGEPEPARKAAAPPNDDDIPF